jgi:tetratricopeptide (TPR) repeat protein
MRRSIGGWLSELRKISAEEFVRRLKNRPEHTEYALLLGAGCSVSSGIPAAGTLVTDHWLPQLSRYREGDGVTDLMTWAASEFNDFDATNPAVSYGPVMQETFPTMHDRRSEVERICGGRDPGFAYCVLAKLIERQNPDLNVVLTTNFDDLLADALYLFTASRPLVISHAALARFMRADPAKALVAKLHGDYQLEPLNTDVELAELNDRVRERIAGLLQQRGLIVIGYGGNDKSVMGALEALPEDALGPGVWWVARSEPNERVSQWLTKRGGRWVESADFDQLMLLVQQEFDLPHPEIERWRSVERGYFETFDKIRSAVEKLAESEPSATALKRASADSLDRVMDWWGVELQARPLYDADPEQAARIYEAGIEQFPNSFALLGNYAAFLTTTGRDDRAEELHQRAIELEPNDGNALGNYARHLIWTGRTEEALPLIQRAFEAGLRPASLDLELWLYLYMNGPAEQRRNALTKVKALVLAGVRSPRWDFSGNVKQAIADGHPESDWLKRLSAVATDDLVTAELNGWKEWENASEPDKA